ncbi:MAG: hypothetical protein ACXWQ5_00790 [Ktedonobacterales bacterium]
MASLDGRVQRETGKSGVAAQVMRHCKKEPHSKFWRYVGHLGQEGGMPDIHGVVCGIAVFIECKREGEGPNERQMLQMRELEEAGAIVGIARSAADAEEILERARAVARRCGLYRENVSTFLE